MRQIAIIGLILACAAVWADEPVTTVIDLNALDAATAVAMFATDRGPEASEILDQAAVDFALNTMQQVAQLRSPGREMSLPTEGVSAARALNTNSQNLSHLLPRGLSGPPTAAPNRNALIVAGTPEAIDQFREILALLDVPAQMVNIALRLDEVGSSVMRNLTPEMHSWGVRADADLGGPAVGPNLLTYALGNLNLLGGAGYGTTSSRGMTEAQITGTSGQPMLIAAGEVKPWFAASVYYDPWGRRHVDYIPYAVFTGVTFWVLPTVLGDNAVKMQIMADFSETGGPAPDVRAGDVIVHQLVETTVVAGDGQPLVIGGLSRRMAEATARWPGASSSRRSGTEGIITITPHIIHTMEH